MLAIGHIVRHRIVDAGDHGLGGSASAQTDAFFEGLVRDLHRDVWGHHD